MRDAPQDEDSAFRVSPRPEEPPQAASRRMGLKPTHHPHSLHGTLGARGRDLLLVEAHELLEDLVGMLAEEG